MVVENPKANDRIQLFYIGMNINLNMRQRSDSKLIDSTASQDRVAPFYFGPLDKQLFGLYHAPQPGQERDFGVVLCNPWGQEFVRAHRAISQLAVRLARQDFPVLRFDFYGTGDSSGEDVDGTLTQWQADIRAAIHELKRRSRVERVFLAGLRLGASLAALVASGRDDVEGLVLWEPAVQGPEYLQDLTTWHEEKQYYFLSNVKISAERTELLGFGLHETLLADLAGLDLLAMKRKPAGRILVIENAAALAEAQSSVGCLCEHLRALGAAVNYQRLESFKMWAEDPDKGLVPQLILQAVVSWLVQEAG
jgi:exosortase A-associated hydrolase 2